MWVGWVVVALVLYFIYFHGGVTMATINGFRIKGLKQFRGHEGEVLFQGDLYLNGNKLGFWSQDSHGGPDNFVLEGGWKQVRTLDDIIKGMYPEKALMLGDGERPIVIKYGLEHLLADLVELMGDEKTFKKAIKNGFAGVMIATDGRHETVWQLPASYVAMADGALMGKMGAAIRSAKEGFYPEDDYTRHSVKVYRCLEDFVVGEPIGVGQRSVDSVLKNAVSRSRQAQAAERNTILMEKE